MRVAVAGVPGAWSSERMVDALRQHGIDSFCFSLGDCLHHLSSRTVLLGGFDLRELDAVVVKKLATEPTAVGRLRLHMLRELEGRGVRVYSRPSVIERVMDRYRMTMMLISAGLPVPETYAAESEASLKAATMQLANAVVKPVYTSKGRGFVRTDGRGASSTLAIEMAGAAVLAQRFVDGPGRDIGACVLDGRFAGAFYRVAADGQWLTTTAAGGQYAPCELPLEGRRLAEAAAGACGLDYTVVDLVEKDGGFAIYEVSAFGGFRGLWEAYRCNVAEEYAGFIKSDLLG